MLNIRFEIRRGMIKYVRINPKLDKLGCVCYGWDQGIYYKAKVVGRLYTLGDLHVVFIKVLRVNKKYRKNLIRR